MTDKTSPNSSKKKFAVFVLLGGMWVISLAGTSVFSIFGCRWVAQNWPLGRESQESAQEAEVGYVQGESVEIETDITKVVDRVRPSVVSVARVSARIGEEGIGEYSDAIGTGFVIDSEKGIVLTNQHVVNNSEQDYSVITSDGDNFKVAEVFNDDAYDIALLKVVFTGDSAPPAVSLGDSEALGVGERVIAIGNPLGSYPGTVTEGIISGLDRDVQAGDGRGSVRVYEDVIQTDAAINFGNSGGPLLNLAGQVVGVNFGVNRAFGAEGISFAIPINHVKARLEVFDKHGYFPKPYIGVAYTMVGEIEASVYDIPQGAFVKEVESGSPADKSGIKPGDVIIKIDGENIEGTLWTEIQTRDVGDKITLTVWRTIGRDNPKELTLELTLGDSRDSGSF